MDDGGQFVITSCMHAYLSGPSTIVVVAVAVVVVVVVVVVVFVVAKVHRRSE